MLKMIRLAQNTSAIRYAKELLARCESGEVIAVTAIEEKPNGKYSVVGTSIPNKWQSAGMLMDAAIARLQQDD